MNLATSTMGSLTQKSSKSVQYFKNYVKICKFKAKLGAPEYTVVVSSFDQAKHRNQNQVFEDSVAETPRLPERPTTYCSGKSLIHLQFCTVVHTGKVGPVDFHYAICGWLCNPKT